jgi:YVTN family beta-propeller protein
MKHVSVKTLLFLLVISAVSCTKDEVPVGETPEVTRGVYVLNEGNFNANNTTLTYYSFQTQTPVTDFYFNANGRGLGDTGNDMILYGGKLYIVMNVSSYVEVAGANDAKSLKRIPLETSSGVKRMPRFVVGYKNKVFVSSYDGTVAVIDTTSLEVEKYIQVGSNPENMVVSGENLYVVNSGGLNPVFDSTVSVIDLASLTEVDKITVGVNPAFITADEDGYLYVACTGNYFDIPASLVKVKASTKEIVKSADTAVGKIFYHDGLLYATGGYFGSPHLRTLHTDDFSQTRDNFITDGTIVSIPYGVKIDEENGDVYLTDVKDFSSSGEVFCFDKNGRKKFSFSVAPGVNPHAIALIK